MSDENLAEILGEDELFLLEDVEELSQISDAQLLSATELGQKQLRLENAVESIEELLKKTKEALAVVKRDLLPKKMIELNLTSFKLQTGEEFVFENVVAANMPKAEAPEFPRAIRWLDDAGIGDIVKKQVFADFGRGDSEMAQRVMQRIQEETNGQVPVQLKESVNYQTLNAALKQRMRAGESLPKEDDGFTIYIGPQSKMKRPKK